MLFNTEGFLIVGVNLTLWASQMSHREYHDSDDTPCESMTGILH